MSDKKEQLKEYYGDDELAASVLADKYLLDGESKPEEMWERLAHAAAGVELQREIETGGNICDELQGIFYDLLKDFKFIPGGRIMYALGREEKVSNTNCYVIPHKEDSIEGIYDWMKESALTYRSTGGVGTDISILRPRGTPVKNSGGVSPGACSFMDLMSNSTNTVHQKLRRGALMITINCFSGDTWILTDKGWKTIKDIVENKLVLMAMTENGFKKITAYQKFEDRQLYEVVATNGKKIKVTSDHKFMVKNIENEKEYLKPLKDIDVEKEELIFLDEQC